MMRPVNRFSRISRPARPTARPPTPPMASTAAGRGGHVRRRVRRGGVRAGKLRGPCATRHPTSRTRVDIQAKRLHAEDGGHHQCQHTHQLVHRLQPPLPRDVALELALPRALADDAVGWGGQWERGEGSGSVQYSRRGGVRLLFMHADLERQTSTATRSHRPLMLNTTRAAAMTKVRLSVERTTVCTMLLGRLMSCVRVVCGGQQSGELSACQRVLGADRQATPLPHGCPPPATTSRPTGRQPPTTSLQHLGQEVLGQRSEGSHQEQKLQRLVQLRAGGRWRAAGQSTVGGAGQCTVARRSSGTAAPLLTRTPQHAAVVSAAAPHPASKHPPRAGCSTRWTSPSCPAPSSPPGCS